MEREPQALQTILADASDAGVLGAPEELPEMHRCDPVPCAAGRDRPLSVGAQE